MKKRWYAVYTKPNTEKKVSVILARKKIENYFPLNKVIRNHGVTTKIINTALFPCYIFVYVTENQLIEVKRTRGIVNIVYWLGDPVMVNDLEINLIKRFLNDHFNVTAEKIVLAIETSGSVDNLILETEGSFMTVSHKKVRAILPSLGYQITAEINSNIRIISSDNLIHQTKPESYRLPKPVHTFYNLFKN
ncbi:MAG: transcription termination/antitermination NusG family protein [Ginsengibacter sp.]